MKRRNFVRLALAAICSSAEVSTMPRDNSRKALVLLSLFGSLWERVGVSVWRGGGDIW